VDLTMPIREDMPRNLAHGRFPLVVSGTQSHAALRLRNVPNPYDSTDHVTTANDAFLLSTHTGTHMDAPFHADERSSTTIESVSLDYGAGPAVCLDVSAWSGPRAAVTAEQLSEAAARIDGGIQAGDIVLIRTDWDDSMEHDPVAWYEEHPGLSRGGAEWLRAQGARTVGIDSCSVDPAGAADLPAHMNFLRPGPLGSDAKVIMIIESLVGLSQLPSARFEFFGVPLPLVGATGSPIRALARLSPA
jgi:kynurenine formamidase